MPIMQAFIFDGFAQQQKDDLKAAYTDAIVADLSAVRKQVRVLISEVKGVDTSIGGEGGLPISLLHIYLMQGRTEAQKAALVATLTDDTARILHVEQASVRVLFHDMPTSDVGIGGVTAKALGR